ncbi:MAG TPA: hypothetical protein VL356_08330 [Acidocella sp.]|jgi:hypothetical protein|nr:hypothetical protein [Acidocella sp.]
MNLNGIWTIYRTEMARMRRTFWQSVATPVITTVLYFVVFGHAIGAHIQHIGGVGYGAFIVPGLIMLTLLTQSIGNASLPSISRFLRKPSMRSSPRRSLPWKSCWPMSARLPPNQSCWR